MTPFDRLKAVAAPLPIENVDTDRILPAAFLKTVCRDGLGQHLLAPLRYDGSGIPRRDFVLNREPWSSAGIIVSLANFGCGSSREHAPWALLDFGIRAIIAPSFADIFRRNCVRNGILPAIVRSTDATRLISIVQHTDRARLNVDLQALQIEDGEGGVTRFEVDGVERSILLSGQDEIDVTLDHLQDIEDHFDARDRAKPWLKHDFG